MTLRVLIVEDNEGKRRRFQGVLEAANVPSGEVRVAESMVEARDALRRTTFDLMILDIALPNVAGKHIIRTGGIDLLDEMDAMPDEYRRPTTIVGVTAHEDLSAEYEGAFADRVLTLLRFDPVVDEWEQRLSTLISDLQHVRRQQAQDASRLSFDRDVCVVTALRTPELRAVRDIREWNFNAQPRLLNADTYYHEGVISVGEQSFSVVASAAPRMGLVAAALHTQKLIHTFRPRVLVMVGICGGVRDRVNLGDVIMADPAWEWQSGKRVKGEDGFVFQSEPHQLAVSRRVSARFDQFLDDVATWARIQQGWPTTMPVALRGIRAPVASGSAVLADGGTVAELREIQHRKLTGIEMEIYGVYAAAEEFSSVQPLTFAMKGVSDLADEHKGDDYQAYAAYTSAQAMRFFIESNIADFVHMQEGDVAS